MLTLKYDKNTTQETLNKYLDILNSKLRNLTKKSKHIIYILVYKK